MKQLLGGLWGSMGIVTFVIAVVHDHTIGIVISSMMIGGWCSYVAPRYHEETTD